MPTSQQQSESRELAPKSSDHEGGPTLVVDRCVRLTDTTVLVDGWCAEAAEVGWMNVAAVTDGRVVKVDAPLLRRERPDVAEALGDTHRVHYGFVGCVPATSDDTITLRFTTPSGSKVERVSTIDPSPTSASDYVTRVRMPTDRIVDVVHHHVEPVLAYDTANRSAPVVTVRYESRGLPEATAVNLVVPIYANRTYVPNFMMFLANSGWSDFILTLVCDDPSMNRQFDAWVHTWQPIYGVPVRLVSHKVNGGFAHACNSGVQATASDRVLLVNSDVLLHNAQSLRTLSGHLADPGVAAVAPALLYPDGSVQHAGMVMESSETFPGTTLPQHPLKGLPPSLLPNYPFDVPLLSGAALMTRRSDYLAVGGMPTRYGRGDFEDVEFSVLMSERGSLRIDPSVRWTHMEGASYVRDDPTSVLFTIARRLLVPHDVIERVPSIDFPNARLVS